MFRENRIHEIEDKNVAKQRCLQKQSLKLSEFGKLYERMQLGR